MNCFRLIILSLLLAYANSMNASGILMVGDTLVKVTGTIVDAETKEPVQGKLFYEKLPYYDDMGIGTSRQDNGVYQLFMVKSTSYNLKVSAEGYEEVQEEIVVTIEADSLVMSKDFELKPNADNDKISLHNLIFARGRAVISKSSYQELDEFAQWLHHHKDVKFRLDGHTDFQGNADANMRLSQDRVDAVRAYLMKKGVKGSRVKTKAFGGSEPLSRERTDAAKNANRRVEVTIL
ncbi:MAG: OmpA family protein [Cyclobacteriaceae bacterium]